MFASHQQDLIKRFFLGLSVLNQENLRRDDAKVRIGLRWAISDKMKSSDYPDFSQEQIKSQNAVFEKLVAYQFIRKLINKIVNTLFVIVFFITVYIFFRNGWALGLIIGISSVVLISIINTVLLLIMAPGFSPLKLGLTHTECSFVLEEIVGHPRWIKESQLQKT